MVRKDMTSENTKTWGNCYSFLKRPLFFQVVGSDAERITKAAGEAS